MHRRTPCRVLWMPAPQLSRREWSRGEANHYVLHGHRTAAWRQPHRAALESGEQVGRQRQEGKEEESLRLAAQSKLDSLDSLLGKKSSYDCHVAGHHYFNYALLDDTSEDPSCLVALLHILCKGLSMVEAAALPEPGAPFVKTLNSISLLTSQSLEAPLRLEMRRIQFKDLRRIVSRGGRRTKTKQMDARWVPSMQSSATCRLVEQPNLAPENRKI